MQPVLETTDVIAHDDFTGINAAIRLRLPEGDGEAERLARMDQLVHAGSALSKALTAYTRCTLVNCRGTYGAGDLGAEAEVLSRALNRYATLVRAVAAEYRVGRGEPAQPRRGSSDGERTAPAAGGRMTATERHLTLEKSHVR